MSSIIIYGGSGSESGSYDQNDLTASKKDVVLNYTYIGADTDTDYETQSTGTMPTTGSIKLTISKSITVPRGYLTENSDVTATDLVNLLNDSLKGTASAAYIRKGKTAYVQGKKIQGTLESLYW